MITGMVIALATLLAVSLVALAVLLIARARNQRALHTLADILAAPTDGKPGSAMRLMRLSDTLDSFAKGVGRGPLAAAAKAASSMAVAHEAANWVADEIRSGIMLPPSFVPMPQRGPDDILRSLGVTEGSGCMSAGYSALRYPCEWMDYKTANPRFGWFAILKVVGQNVWGALLASWTAMLANERLSMAKSELHRQGILADILYALNARIHELAIQQGRYAAMILGLWDAQEHKVTLASAGNSFLWHWNSRESSVITVSLKPTPALGPFDNFIIENRTPFACVDLQLNPGDSLIAVNDLDSMRIKRDSSGLPLETPYQEPDGSEINEPKMQSFANNDTFEALLESVGKRGLWKLDKEHGMPGEEDLIFDFSSCAGSPRDYVLAVAAAERIFRMYPAPEAGPEDLVYLDPDLDAFLVEHFPKLGLYRKEGLTRILESRDLAGLGFYNSRGDGRVVAWGGVREDFQYINVSILAIQRKD
jgi:hypothetical protein